MVSLIFALSLLFSLLLYPFFRMLFHRLFVENHELKILKLSSGKDGKIINKIIDAADFKMGIEISVHHMGKEINYYLVVPQSRLAQAERFVRKNLPGIDFREVGDYQLFNYSGVTLAKFLELGSDEDVRRFDFGKLDFSKVNEVGEGAVVQIIHTPRMPGPNFDIRLLSSAPSEYQAREILDALIDSGFSGFKVKDPRDKVKFIHTINFREHGFEL